jgi:HEAT repeat protein
MTERSAAAVRARLADPEPEVRRRAAQELRSLAAPESCELLVTALADADWRVRKEAAATAPSIEPRAAIVSAVARALGERENVGLRNAAVEALVLIGPDAVPGALDALDRLDADGRKLAVEVLAGAPTLAGMKALARAARDADLNVVIAAAEGLGRADLAGDDARELAIGTLGELVASPHAQVRIAALDALCALEASVPWTSIEPLLADPLLRRSAIAAAAGSTAPRALLALAGAIADPDPSCARAAVAALGRSIEEAWEDDALVDVAAKALRACPDAHARLRVFARGQGEVRGAAVLALGLVRDPDDVPLIADALAEDELADRAEAALHLFGEEAVAPLLDAGRTAHPSLRGATISMLPGLARTEAEPLAAVRDALGDPSAEVVASALKSLAIVGEVADLAGVAGLVTSSDAKIASAAHGALLAMARRHPAAARALVRDVSPRGEDALRAVTVIEALAEGGVPRAPDVAFLDAALTHRAAGVRRAAIEALAAVGGEAAAEAVSVALADEEDVVALAAIRALGRLRRAEQLAMLAASTRDPIRLGTALRALRDADPERAFAAARPLVRSREASVAAAAIEVIGRVDLAARVDALLGAADHPDHEVVKLALGEIAKLDDERAFAALASAVEHASVLVRRCAAELLGQTDLREGQAPGKASEADVVLRARLHRERDLEVRQAIMQALAARGARREP